MLKLCLAIAAILDFLSTQKHKFCNEPLKAIPSYVYFQMIHWFQMGIIVKYFNNIKTLFCNGDHPGFLTDTKKKIITGFVTRLTRRVPLVEQELLTLPEHLSSPPVLVGFVLLGL
jgi:hypothetical protein